MKSEPAIILAGLRQTGKSSLVNAIPGASKRRSITLDDLGQLELARRNPEALLAGGGALTIEQAQRAPELVGAIRESLDKDRTPGRLLLTCSSGAASLASGLSTSSGRPSVLPVRPLSMRELAKDVRSSPFLRILWDKGKPPEARKAVAAVRGEEVLAGGLPPVVLGEASDRSTWFRGFEQTLLERDVRELARVGDLLAFRTLVRQAVLRASQIVNVSDLAREARVSSLTANRYLQLVEELGIARRLPPFVKNKAPRLVKSPKMLFADSGFAAFLAGVDKLDAIDDHPLRDSLYTTFVGQNLASILEARWPLARLCFWTVQGRHEIDFVIEVGRESLAINVSPATRLTDADTAGLFAFVKRTPQCLVGIVAYNGEATLALGKRVWAVPMRTLLS